MSTVTVTHQDKHIVSISYKGVVRQVYNALPDKRSSYTAIPLRAELPSVYHISTSYIQEELNKRLEAIVPSTFVRGSEVPSEHAPIWILLESVEGHVSFNARRFGTIHTVTRNRELVEKHSRAPAFHTPDAALAKTRKQYSTPPGCVQVIWASDHPAVPTGWYRDHTRHILILDEPIAMSIDAAVAMIKKTPRVSTWPALDSCFNRTWRESDWTLKESITSGGDAVSASNSKKCGYHCVRLDKAAPKRTKKRTPIRARGSFNLITLDDLIRTMRNELDDRKERALRHHNIRFIDHGISTPLSDRPHYDSCTQMYRDTYPPHKPHPYLPSPFYGMKHGYRTPLNEYPNEISRTTSCLLQLHFAFEYYGLYEPRRRKSPKHELRKALIEPAKELRSVMRSSIPTEQHALLFIRVLHTVACRVGMSGLEPLSAERYPPCPKEPPTPTRPPRSCPRPSWTRERNRSRPRITSTSRSRTTTSSRSG